MRRCPPLSSTRASVAERKSAVVLGQVVTHSLLICPPRVGRLRAITARGLTGSVCGEAFQLERMSKLPTSPLRPQQDANFGTSISRMKTTEHAGSPRVV